MKTKKIVILLSSVVLFICLIIVLGIFFVRGTGQARSRRGFTPQEGNYEWNIVVPPGQTNKYGWTVPEETLKFSMFNARGGWAPTEATINGMILWQQFLKNQFNVEIDYRTTSGSGTQALNLGLASGIYADVIQYAAREVVRRAAELRIAVDLTGYLDTHMPNVKSRIGGNLKYYLINGRFYGIPINMGSISENPDVSGMIRYDEWLEIGSPEIKTPDDFYNAVNTILRLHPSTPNGGQRYSISFASNQRNPEDLSVLWGLRLGYDISPDNKWTYFAFTEQGKMMTRWFNRFYRDGTMDPDAFINRWDDWRAKVSSERVVCIVGGPWTGANAGHEVWSVTDPNWSPDKRFMGFGFKDPAISTLYLTAYNDVSNDQNFITNKAKDVAGIASFTNFVASELGQALVGWGFPGAYPAGNTGKTAHIWDLYDNGRWEFNPVTKQQLINNTFDYSLSDYMGAGRIMCMLTDFTRWPDGIHAIQLHQMFHNEMKYEGIMLDNFAGLGVSYSATDYFLRNTTAESTQLMTAIEDARDQFWPPCVQARNDTEFETAWRNLQNALEAAGIHRFEQIRAENYRNNISM